MGSVIPVCNDVSNKEITQMSPQEKHLLRLAAQVEAAKDPDQYETYEHIHAESVSGIEAFAARRRGNSHVMKRTPCQDYCLVKETGNCLILSVADGVGSCEHSDIGARLACEAAVSAVSAAAGDCRDEEQLRSRLLTMSFRDKLVSGWLRSVLELIRAEGTSHSGEIYEVSKYASTVMFVVITADWYIAGNLGDGQILLFNSSEGMKLRVHDPKEDSKVRCLANEGCAREDFIVRAYPRSEFDGVLLSTDGMYDCLANYTHFHQYALQLKDRFLGKEMSQPVLPFCYQEKGEPSKDFSAVRTDDDCTVVLAVDTSGPDQTGPDPFRTLEAQSEGIIPLRWSRQISTYLIMQDGVVMEVTADKDHSPVCAGSISSAVSEEPLKVWETEGIRFAAYAASEGRTIEELYCCGALRGRAPVSLPLYREIKALHEELCIRGLALNDAAPFLVSYCDGQLRIRSEALSTVSGCENSIFPDVFADYFANLAGAVSCGNDEIPVFDTGFISRGRKLSRMDDTGEGILGQIVKRDKELFLLNLTEYTWSDSMGEMIRPGEGMKLRGVMTFVLKDDDGKVIAEYQYRSKEQL